MKRLLNVELSKELLEQNCPGWVNPEFPAVGGHGCLLVDGKEDFELCSKCWLKHTEPVEEDK